MLDSINLSKIPDSVREKAIEGKKKKLQELHNDIVVIIENDMANFYLEKEYEKLEDDKGLETGPCFFCIEDTKGSYIATTILPGRSCSDCYKTYIDGDLELKNDVLEEIENNLKSRNNDTIISVIGDENGKNKVVRYKYNFESHKWGLDIEQKPINSIDIEVLKQKDEIIKDLKNVIDNLREDLKHNNFHTLNNLTNNFNHVKEKEINFKNFSISNLLDQ